MRRLALSWDEGKISGKSVAVCPTASTAPVLPATKHSLTLRSRLFHATFWQVINCESWFCSYAALALVGYLSAADDLIAHPFANFLRLPGKIGAFRFRVILWCSQGGADKSCKN